MAERGKHRSNLIRYLLPKFSGNNNKYLRLVNGCLSWSTVSSSGYDGDASVINQTSNYRFHTDEQAASWDAKVNNNDPRLTDARTPLSHTHDYAPVNHSHDYAESNHNHNGTYSSISHDHNGVYSLVNHNHDSIYSAIGHNHNGIYALVSHTQGYATGGGSVTQITSKATAVTLNALCGRITMHNAALAAAAEVSFVVNNNQVAATDVIIVNIQSVGTAGSYFTQVAAVGAGSFTITLGNVSTGSLSQAVVLNFAVIKSVIS